MLVINRLHELLRPFMLRRVKTEVMGQLPEKVKVNERAVGRERSVNGDQNIERDVDVSLDRMQADKGDD